MATLTELGTSIVKTHELALALLAENFGLIYLAGALMTFCYALYTFRNSDDGWWSITWRAGVSGLIWPLYWMMVFIPFSVAQ